MLAPLQLFWKAWYQYLSSRVGNDVIFLNYGFYPPEGNTIDLHPEDEPDRQAIQLYHHVASGADLKDKHVLEVSCGHGGGASFVKRYHKPRTYTAIDQNPNAIAFNRKTHRTLDIDFRVGDAQALDFPEQHFDAVLNVEASHCYPRQLDFFRSVHRVLKNDGHFLYTDFRTAEAAPKLDHDLRTAGFKTLSKTDITPHVIEALKRNTARYRGFVHKYMPALLHPIYEKFAGVEGSKVYQWFVTRYYTYYSYTLVKM